MTLEMSTFPDFHLRSLRTSHFAGYWCFKVISAAVPSVTAEGQAEARRRRSPGIELKPRNSSTGELDHPCPQVRRRGSMPAMQNMGSIKIGVVANEPMRLEGLTSIFESHAKSGEVLLQPIIGTLEEHLDNEEIEYVLIDWSSST